MGQTLSDSGPPPMTVGMSQDVYNRIRSKSKQLPEETSCAQTGKSETGSKLENSASAACPKPETPASESGAKLGNPNKSSPCEPEKPRRVSDLYLRKTSRIFSPEPGGVASGSEYWERTLGEQRVFGEEIDKVLEAEKRRGFNDVEDLLPPISDTSARMRGKICSENFTQLTQCYQENSSRPLLCAEKANELFGCFKDRAYSAGRKNLQ